MSDKNEHPQPDSEATTPAPETSAAVPAAPHQGRKFFGRRGQQPRPPRPTRPAGPFKRGFSLGAGAGLGAGASLTVLTTVLTLLSMIPFVVMAVIMAGPAGQTAVEPLTTVWGKETAPKKLRAIPIKGAIMADSSDGSVLSGGVYGYEIAELLDKLEAKDADGVVFVINTPGGSINGSRAMADAVNRYRERTGKKVFTYVQGMSASGGMYTMANSDKIIADHGSFVGSIGVISGPFERYRDVTGTTGTIFQSGVTTKGGITSEYLAMGRGKDFGSPYRDMTPEERTVWMNALSFEYDQFVNWVSKYRGVPAETIKTKYGAHMFDTKTAEAYKLIDGTMGRDEAFRYFAQEAGLDPNQTKIVQSQAPSGFAALFGAENRAWGQAPAAKPENGQPARATAPMCSGTPQVYAFHGSMVGVCR